MDVFDTYYYDQDHLGNIRQVTDKSGKAVQTTDYYPFGMQLCDGTTSNFDQKHKYNGKEFDKMHGLNTYDYGARQHDPILCRWDRIDSLNHKNKWRNKEMKYIRLFIVIFSFCYVTVIHGQTQLDSLDIDSINSEYKIGSQLRITYTNKCQTPLYVEVSLEGCSNNNNWNEIFKDIFADYKFEHSPIDGSVEILPLIPKSLGTSQSMTPILDSRTDIWKVDKRLLSVNGESQIYRLKYRVCASAQNILADNKKEEEKIMYSKPFYIKACKSKKSWNRCSGNCK